MIVPSASLASVIRNRSIGSTLVLAATIPAIFMFIVLAWVLYYSGKDEVLSSLKNKGQLVAASLSESSRYGLISGNVDELTAVSGRFLEIEPGLQRIRITRADGQELVDLKGSSTASTSPLVFSRDVVHAALNTSDADAYANTEPADGSGEPFARSKKVGTVVVELSPEQLWAAQRDRIWASALAILVVALVSGSVGLVMVNRLRITLRNLISALRELRKGNFDVRFSDEKQGELGEIQRTLVEMAFALSKNQLELESTVNARTVELRDAIAKVNRVDSERQRLIQDSNKKLEQERKRIAVDIHDQINASLIGLRLQAEAIEALTKDQQASPQTMCALNSAAKAMTQTVGPLYAVCRSIIHQLRPEVLETLGLAGAVEDLLHGYRSTNNHCSFTLELAANFPKLNQDQSIAIYRVIQEALNNIAKHAHASHAKVRMAPCSKEENAVCVEITDDGRGFDTEATTGGSLGLIGMRERVHGLGGRIVYHSVVGSGTAVRIHLPRVLEEMKG